MPSLKAIRKRISSVKSTQKITRAMKMVAGARLARAQARITALRPYALKTQTVLGAVVASMAPPGDGALVVGAGADGGDAYEPSLLATPAHPLLAERPEKRVMLVV